MTRYVSAEKMRKDDFGDTFTMEEGEVVYDAKTSVGVWATMSQASWDVHAHPRKCLGVGWGQKYVRDANGHLNKVEG